MSNQKPWQKHSFPTPSCGLLWWPIFRSPIIKSIHSACLRREDQRDVAFVGETFIRFRTMHSHCEGLIDVWMIEDLPAKIKAAAILGESRLSEHDEEFEQSTHGRDKSSLNPPQVLVLILDNFHLAAVSCRGETLQNCDFYLHACPLPISLQLHGSEIFLAADSHNRAIAVAASSRYLIIYGLEPPSYSRGLSVVDRIEVQVALRLTTKVLSMEFLYPIKEDSDRVILLLAGLEDNKLVMDIYFWDFSSFSTSDNIQKRRHPLGKEHKFPISLIPLKSEIAAGYFMLVDENRLFLYLVSTNGAMEQTSSKNLWDLSEIKSHALSSFEVPISMPLWNNWARPIRNSDWRHEAFYLGREDGAIGYVQIGASRPGGKLNFEVLRHMGDLGYNIDTAMAAFEYAKPFLDPKRAFSNPPKYRDTLLVAGTDSKGCMFEIDLSVTPKDLSVFRWEEFNEPDIRVEFPNWAPLTALAVTEEVASSVSQAQLDFQNTQGLAPQVIPPMFRNKLFAGSGNQPHGAVTELRYGIEVPVSIRRKLQRLEQSVNPGESLSLDHCNAIWPIEGKGKVTMFLFSFPWYSAMACYNPDCDAVVDHVVFSYNEPTLAASTDRYHRWTGPGGEKKEQGLFFSQLAICVTATQVQLLKMQLAENQSEKDFDVRDAAVTMVKKWEIEHCIFAIMDPYSNNILTARLRSEEQVKSQVSLTHVGFNAGDPCLVHREAALFDEEISCLSYLDWDPDISETRSNGELHECIYFGIGMRPGSLHIARIWCNDAHVEIIFTYYIQAAGRGLDGPMDIESIVLLERKNDDSFQVLCGSRNGILHILEVELEQHEHEPIPRTVLKNAFQTNMGDSPLRILPDPTQQFDAFVLSGSDIAVIDVTTPWLTPRFTSVYFSDAEETSFSLDSIDAIIWLDDSDVFYGGFFAVSNGQILAGEPTSKPKALAVHREITGTASKVLYSKQWHLLVVAAQESHFSTTNHKKYSLSVLFCMDPNTSKEENVNQRELDQYAVRESAFYCRPNERICDLVECFIQRTNKLYHFLVATTMITKEDGRESGRILYFNNKQKLSLVSETLEPAPVFSICQTKSGSLVYCCGNEIKMRVYDTEKKKWLKFILWNQLASPGMHIGVRDNMLIVATQLHSIQVFALNEDIRCVHGLYSGGTPAPGISFLDVPCEELILLTTRDNRVIGFSGAKPVRLGINEFGKAELEDHQSDWKQLFDASLPSKVTRLVTANTRPPWRQFKIPGIKKNDMIGTATDGSTYSFSLLTTAAWQLLHFLHVLHSQHSVFRPPFDEEGSTYFFKRQSFNPHDTCIDGRGLLALSQHPEAEARLEQMLQTAPPRERFHPLTGEELDYESPAKKRAALKRLLMNLLNESRIRNEHSDPQVANGPENSWGSWAEDDLARMAMKYLRSVFDLPL